MLKMETRYQNEKKQKEIVLLKQQNTIKSIELESISEQNIFSSLSGKSNLLESFGKLDKRLIFISDGAMWIKNWIEDAFPQAISILDYYHACEHLHEFSSRFFKDKDVEQKWTKQQKDLLLESQVCEVIKNIDTLAGNKNKEAEKLIAYYQTNKERMQYKHYKQMGCGIIGSGAIESAHRTVIQKRMNLSGQR